MIKHVTVFCASTPSGPRAQEYLAMARNFGVLLARNGFVCVNGASSGLMTELSRAVAEEGGEVHGVALGEKPEEADASSYSSVEYLSPLSPRQQRLIERGDAYVALAGGIGTHYEIFEILCRKMLGEIDKPLICIGDTYAPLQQLLSAIKTQGLAFTDVAPHISFVSSEEEAIALLNRVHES